MCFRSPAEVRHEFLPSSAGRPSFVSMRSRKHREAAVRSARGCEAGENSGRRLPSYLEAIRRMCSCSCACCAVCVVCSGSPESLLFGEREGHRDQSVSLLRRPQLCQLPRPGKWCSFEIFAFGPVQPVVDHEGDQLVVDSHLCCFESQLFWFFVRRPLRAFDMSFTYGRVLASSTRPFVGVGGRHPHRKV